MQASLKAYNLISAFVIIFLTVIGMALCLPYQNPPIIFDGQLIIKITAIALPILIIATGNMFGKVRQNFMFGIRTPWTLASELSWEKTHRIGGRVFVLAGIISLFAAFISPMAAIICLASLLLGALIFICIYSYLIWKQDPNKRV